MDEKEVNSKSKAKEAADSTENTTIENDDKTTTETSADYLPPVRPLFKDTGDTPTKEDGKNHVRGLLPVKRKFPSGDTLTNRGSTSTRRCLRMRAINEEEEGTSNEDEKGYGRWKNYVRGLLSETREVPSGDTLTKRGSIRRCLRMRAINEEDEEEKDEEEEEEGTSNEDEKDMEDVNDYILALPVPFEDTEDTITKEDEKNKDVLGLHTKQTAPFGKTKDIPTNRGSGKCLRMRAINDVDDNDEGNSLTSTSDEIEEDEEVVSNEEKQNGNAEEGKSKEGGSEENAVVRKKGRKDLEIKK